MVAVSEDHVVLVDDSRRALGLAPRATVHGPDTPLHLAFSCYLFRPTGELLLTRRSLAKVAWPGVWTNSFCGHPRLDESFEQTIQRYAAHELGLGTRRIEQVLPDFRYRAEDASGIVENEICPVFTAFTSEDPRANPDEVMDHHWVPVADVETLVQTAPWAVSPWMRLQWPGVLDALRNPGSRGGPSGPDGLSGPDGRGGPADAVQP